MGEGDSAGRVGEGISLTDSGPCRFLSSLVPGAVPVQGPLGLMRPGSAVAMAMGEGGVWVAISRWVSVHGGRWGRR